jgi:hypothetical protein
MNDAFLPQCRFDVIPDTWARLVKTFQLSGFPKNHF